MTVAAVLLAVLAMATVSQAATDPTCQADLPPELPPTEVACGLANSTESPTQMITMYCSATAKDLSENKQLSSRGSKVCYLIFKPEGDNLQLTLTPGLMVSAGYSKTTRVQLDKSVSLLVGITANLLLEGQSIASVNPEIFADIGDSQKSRLHTIVMTDTSVESLDASLLKPLNISRLVLIDNKKLSKFTNLKDVELPSLKELHLAIINIEFMNCRNFKSLPSGITKLFLFTRSENFTSGADTCAFCSLPSSVSEVGVRKTVSKLPFHPSVSAGAPGFPYPLSIKPVLSVILPPPGPIKWSKFTVSASTASGCEKCNQRCNPWQPAATTAAPTKAAPSREVDKGSAVEQGSVKASDGGSTGSGAVGGSSLFVAAAVAMTAAAAAVSAA